MNWRVKYKDKIVSPEEAAKRIEPGDVLCCSIAAGIPYATLDALSGEAERLRGTRIDLGMGLKPIRPYMAKYNGLIDIRSLFWGPLERTFIKTGSKIAYQPVHLSDTTPDRTEYHRASVVLSAGTPPDKNGMISLGPCPLDEIMCDTCRTVIVQVNEKLPYVKGVGCMFPIDKVDLLVDKSEDVPSIEPIPPSPEEAKIAGFIAERVPDGACIQLGIGGLGTAVGGFLKDKKELGIHTEMFVESMVDLIECGAVTNSRKNICPGKSVFGFALGSRHMYELMDGNPAFETRPFSWVNDPRIIAQNDNMVSINGALQLDLTGQVCAESIGMKQYSGTGGQVDFVRGAHWSKGGMSFIALPSVRTDKAGNMFSKISISLPLGSAVTTLRSDVHYVVTEYGCVNIRNEPLDIRAERLISIAHPAFRDELRAQAKKEGLII